MGRCGKRDGGVLRTCSTLPCLFVEFLSQVSLAQAEHLQTLLQYDIIMLHLAMPSYIFMILYANYQCIYCIFRIPLTFRGHLIC